MFFGGRFGLGMCVSDGGSALYSAWRQAIGGFYWLEGECDTWQMDGLTLGGSLFEKIWAKIRIEFESALYS